MRLPSRWAMSKPSMCRGACFRPRASCRAATARLRLSMFPFQAEAGRFQGHVQDPGVLALARGAQLQRGAGEGAQELPQRRQAPHRRQVYGARRVVPAAVVLPQKLRQELLLVSGVAQQEGVAPHQVPAPHGQHHQAHLPLGAEPADVIPRLLLEVHDLLLLGQGAHRRDLVAQNRRLLVGPGRRGFLHAGGQLGKEVLGASGKQEADPLHQLLVLLAAHLAGAHPVAAADVVVEAGLGAGLSGPRHLRSGNSLSIRLRYRSICPTLG